MSPLMVGALGFAALIGLMALNLPIFAAFAVVGILGIGLLKSFDTSLVFVGMMPYSWSSYYVLVTVPMFVLMGMFAFHSGISRSLFESAHKWLGHLPGGLAMATTAACTAFAACTGSSVASAAAMGSVCLPEMKRLKYDNKLATGVVAAGGTLGILIPPSTIFILYGVFTETSIGRLFMSGLIPGLMLAILFMITIYIMVRRDPSLSPLTERRFSWKERFASLKGVIDMLMLFALVIGGMFFGIFTPTEAGAVGAFGAFMIALSRRRLSWHKLVDALAETSRLTAMIILIVVGAMIYNTFIGLSGLPMAIGNWVASLPLPPHAVLGLILLTYIPLGMFMDTLALLVLTLPIFFPVVTKTLGFDPIHYGVLMVLMCEMALITPPVGMNVYVITGVSKDVPMEDIFRGIAPFIGTLVIAVTLLVAFPELSLFLPNALMGGQR